MCIPIGFRRRMISLCAGVWLAVALWPAAHAAHGYAMWGQLKYPDNFAHFDYVNPDAPKGGSCAW